MAEVPNLVDFDAYDTRRGFRLANRYALTRSIRTTGVGQTYLADDTEAAKQVLVVVHTAPWADDPSRKNLFETRARTLAGLEHANLASVLDHGIIDGRCFAVLERFEGERLSDRLARKSRRGSSGRPMSAEEVVPIVSQLLKALEYAHARGVLARRLDPAHVLLCNDGVHANIVRVVGVGIAELMQNLVVPEEAALVGDPDFASPEQLRGEPATTQSDVFAIGRLMLAMLHGCPLPSGPDVARDTAGALPESLIAVIEASVRPLPRQRPLDAAALVEMLIDAVPNASMFRLPRITGSHATLARRPSPAPPRLSSPLPSPPPPSADAHPVPPKGALQAEAPAARRRSRVLLWSGITLALAGTAGAFALSESYTAAPDSPPPEAAVFDTRPSPDPPAPAASSAMKSPPSLPSGDAAEDPAAPTVVGEASSSAPTPVSEPSRSTRSKTARRRSAAQNDTRVDEPPDPSPSPRDPSPKAPSLSTERKRQGEEDPFLTPSRKASEPEGGLLPGKDGP